MVDYQAEPVGLQHYLREGVPLGGELPFEWDVEGFRGSVNR